MEFVAFQALIQRNLGHFHQQEMLCVIVQTSFVILFYLCFSYVCVWVCLVCALLFAYGFIYFVTLSFVFKDLKYLFIGILPGNLWNFWTFYLFVYHFICFGGRGMYVIKVFYSVFFIYTSTVIFCDLTQIWI